MWFNKTHEVLDAKKILNKNKTASLTCGVLSPLLQIPQHCTHTPFVPIILNFRVIAAEREEMHFKDQSWGKGMSQEASLKSNTLNRFMRHWSSLPDIITALFVQTVVGEMHEIVLDVCCSLIVLNCSKSMEKKVCFFKLKIKGKKECKFSSTFMKL